LDRKKPDRAVLEGLWREVVSQPNNLSSALDRFTWKGWDRLTNPGFVGRDFDGVVFLAKNPGNGSVYGPDALEYALFSSLDALRRGEPTFDRFHEYYRAGLKSWSIGRYMADANAPLELIAFLNLVPWRTNPEKMDTASWREAAAKGYQILISQLTLLNPREIVILGKSTQDLLAKLPPLGIQSVMIERSNGDSHIKPAAAALLADLGRRMGW
jgi:hypothetical protein